MPSILLSGPAGGGKSQEAERLLLEAAVPPTVLVDYTALWAALRAKRRDRKGRYPERDDGEHDYLAYVETVRQAAIRIARERELDVIATNSDGSPRRRAYLLALLGPLAVERIVDPGRPEVERRLTLEDARGLSEACREAIDRWYGRVGQ